MGIIISRENKVYNMTLGEDMKNNRINKSDLRLYILSNYHRYPTDPLRGYPTDPLRGYRFCTR
jgi:hypothetical protein